MTTAPVFTELARSSERNGLPAFTASAASAWTATAKRVLVGIAGIRKYVIYTITHPSNCQLRQLVVFAARDRSNSVSDGAVPAHRLQQVHLASGTLNRGVAVRERAQPPVA